MMTSCVDYRGLTTDPAITDSLHHAGFSVADVCGHGFNQPSTELRQRHPGLPWSTEIPGRLTAATVITDLRSEGAAIQRLAIPAPASRISLSIDLSIYVPALYLFTSVYLSICLCNM